MDRHAVISFSSQPFNSQLLKASHSFQRVSPGEEEKEVAEENIFHQTWHGRRCAWIDATGECITHCQAEPGHFQQAGTMLLQSPGLSPALGTGLVRPKCPWNTGTCLVLPGGVKCSSKGYAANFLLLIPGSIPAPWYSRDGVFPLQHLTLGTPVGEDREMGRVYFNEDCSPSHTSQGC